jgi:D-alanyl-D-alanine endopeptidase (penicillin-binding protein 7)
MTSSLRRFVLAAMTAAVVAGLAGATPAYAAAKRKTPPKQKHKKAIATERLVSATKRGQPNVQAAGSLVIDETGATVFAHNPDHERPIASISKLAAMLAVVDKGLELEGLTTINHSDAEIAKNGAKSRLLEGMTLSNRDLLHAALMGSDNRAVPALGRAVKMTPAQLVAAMNAKARQLGLKNTRFQEPTGLSVNNVSTPREVIVMLKHVIAHPVLGPITRRGEYDAHPVGKPPITYRNTDRQASRSNVQLLGGKTGYNDFARYCLVVATKIDAKTYYMAFLGDEGKLTRFGDVARVADWIVSHKSKTTIAAATPAAAPAAAPAPVVVVPFAPGTSAEAAATAPPVPAAAAAPPASPASELNPPQPPVPIGVAAAPPSGQPAPSATP